MTSYTIPPNTRAVGTGNPPQDMDNTANILSMLTGQATGNTFTQSYTALPWFNVITYGADPTGATDSTTAIQNALNAANSAGGGVVYFPAGTYKISSALTIYNNITLTGDNRQVSVIEQTSTTAHGLSWSGNNLQYVTIKNLQLLGPNSGSGIGINLNNLAGGANPNIIGCHFIDLLVQEFGGDGIAASILIVSQFDNVIVASCGGDGFSLTGGVNTSVVFNACYANGCVGSGYDLENCTYVTLNACAADSNNLGYYVSNAGGVTLNSCGAESSPYGFKIDGGVSCTLNSCFTYANSNVSFWAADSAVNVTFVGCFESTPNAATHSFQFDAGTDVNIIGMQFTTSTLQTAVSNQLNDGAGNFQSGGQAFMNGLVNIYTGTSTQFGAATFTPTISTGTPVQIDTTVDVMLYADITTSNTFAWTMGSTSAGTGVSIVASHTAAAGSAYCARVPAGWYVKSTFTSADVTWTAVTC